jgi:mxaA protein
VLLIWPLLAAGQGGAAGDVRGATPAIAASAVTGAPAPAGDASPAAAASAATGPDRAGAAASAAVGGRTSEGATAAAAAVAAPANAIVEQPRAYGHAVGDVLTQRVRLQLAGREFEPAELPRAERVGAWFERREPRIERAPDGTRWLVAEHQLINAPPALRTVVLPAWEIAPRGAGERLRVAAWPVTIAPITARSAPAQGALQSLQPDRPAPAIDVSPIERRLAAWLAGLAATAACWAAWLAWRQWRASRRQPFAIAWRELRGLDPSAPTAWQAMHRAFDRTAERVVQPATLGGLFQRAPHLAPARDEIERFYAQSAQRFFGGSLPAQPVDIRSLCARLRRIEKRHER